MGMPGPWELLIILAIVALLFGTKKLRNLGSDVGSIVKGYQSAMKGDKEDKAVTQDNQPAASSDVIDGEVDNTSEKQS